MLRSWQLCFSGPRLFHLGGLSSMGPGSRPWWWSCARHGFPAEVGCKPALALMSTAFLLTPPCCLVAALIVPSWALMTGLELRLGCGDYPLALVEKFMLSLSEAAILAEETRRREKIWWQPVARLCRNSHAMWDISK